MLARITMLLFGEVRPGDSRRSTQWPRVRAYWLNRHPFCAACGTTTNLNVHHKKPFHLFPELELDPENFITLCETPSWNCHFRIGHGGKSWADYVSNVEQIAALVAEASQKTVVVKSH